MPMQIDVSEWPALQGSTADRLILRDGSVALVRRAKPDDRETLQEFFHRLAPESRRNRFFTVSEPPDALVKQFCESADPGQRLTLIAFRGQTDALQAIAVASYAATGPKVAEVAFAVADGMHGKGLGTALLEQLAAIATANGFDAFEATTLADNLEMLEVFRDSGFSMRSKSAQGVAVVRLDLRPSPQAIAAIDERNRAATVASLRPILQPRSVAVFGASRNPLNLGRRVFDALHRAGFNGSIYAINPHAEEVAGQRCYGSLRDVSVPVDLAVIATPRTEVLQVIDECAASGVKSLVVVSAGFAELDDEGRRLQREVVGKARALGLRMVGPNCMGVLNADPDVRLNASLAEELPPVGHIAVASQSGGIGLALLQLAFARHIGISSFVSLGNKADVSGNDLLQWSESDPQTSVVLLYLESFGNPRRFGQLAQRVGHKKPIVVVKAGRTPSGSRAASSHTAGLASSETAVEALLKQSGVIRATSIDEMFDVAQCLDLQPLPRGHRVGIITNAGGPGILVADACEAAGLAVPPFSAETRARLGLKVSANATIGNPVDLVASAAADMYEHAITTALASSEIDSLIVVYTEITGVQTAAILQGISQGVAAARAAGIMDKPVLTCTVGLTAQPAEIAAGSERIPTFQFPENAPRALAHVVAYARWRREPPALFWTFDDIRADEAKALCARVVAARGDTWLTGEELRTILEAFGLRMVAGETVHSEDRAVAAATRLGYPVVLKLDSPSVIHKSDVGGVRLHVGDEQEVRAAFRELATLFPGISASAGTTGVRVQPMLSGVEVLAGVNRDGAFGPLIGFGRGGVDTELLRDVAFRIAPLNEADVQSLVRETKSYPLLQGYRGRPPADIDALKEMLLRISSLAQAIPELRELDLNPVIALPKGHGCAIVDARARVSAAL
jgi:acyl-CoA synthetase (NDP forming)/GNAT superfamily N-acetyltransferase